MTAVRSYKELATNRGKATNQRDANLCKEETLNQRVMGSNPAGGKRFFLMKTYIKAYLYYNLALELVH